MGAKHLADDAIAALYSAAVSPGQWGRALDIMTELAGARAANCFVQDAFTGAFLEYHYTGYGADAADRYVQHYSGFDLAYEVLLREPAGLIYPLHHQVTDRMVERSKFYQDFYIPEGLRYACGGTLYDRGSRIVLAVHRPTGHRPFDDASARELQRVLNHLPTVFNVKRLNENTREEALLSRAALDSLPKAIAIVDSDLAVRYLNPAAEYLFRQSDDPVIRSGRLSANDPDIRNELTRRIKGACNRTPSVMQVSMTILDKAGRPCAECHVIPLQPRVTDTFARGHSLAMLLLRRPFQQLQSSILTGRQYGLTPAETAVVTALREGLTASEHAARNGVKISTVRSQIRAILSKTGTRRMSDVMTLSAHWEY
ncbi:hypothetical protein BH09PSE5_BH09PSE5_04040 [soil metagenome]